jgi:primosomal protein N' (replication factor Y)
MESHFADVVFPQTIDRAFTYGIPTELVPLAKIGCRVLAPFGKRRLTGFIVGLKDNTDLKESDIKSIQDVLDSDPLFSEELYRLALWISDYYLSPPGDALRAVLPAILFQKSRQYVELVSQNTSSLGLMLNSAAPRQAQIVRFLAKSGRLPLTQLMKRIGARNLVSSINALRAKGFVSVQHIFPKSKAKAKLVKFVRLPPSIMDTEDLNSNSAGRKLTARQIRCLQFLKESDAEISQKDLLFISGIQLSTLKSLQKRELVELFEKEAPRDYYQQDEIVKPPKIKLNEEQQAAFEKVAAAIGRDEFATLLLHGVTGSGKTQVYIEAIYSILEKGKDAIVLVPEIALTPQTVQRFRSHFKDWVAVLHSAMSPVERYDSWRKLKSGEARVAIGPRSAIFAPLRNLGLIVVDEEQEDSYKQADPDPRYHGRDVAVMRAKLNNAVVILGSATPSAESYYNAQIGKYQLLKMQRRVDDIPMPKVEILEMQKEQRLSGKKEAPVFSRMLIHEIEKRIASQQQVILLLNRRGFSYFIKCKSCGFIESCKNCQITLTYHLSGRRLRCHYCGYTKKAPEECPECRGVDVLFRGVGTQRVEEEINQRLPNARVVRMDLDTTGRKWAHDRILRDFERGKYDILLGTQMIAKGLDFQKVTLVGVINADIGLFLPDFRASERSFQLLTQVAGRAGRKNLPGEVIIQTYSPFNFCLICAKTHNFVKFFSKEIEDRRELLYPPFGRIISILFKGRDEKKVMTSAENFAEVLKGQQGPRPDPSRAFQVLGPTPSPLVKIQNKFRWHILVKGSKRVDSSGKIIRQAVREAEKRFRHEFKTRGIQIEVDVDPVSLL